jgi:S-adenosylmethionine-diacylglycerol 3-amino-3-carboxypropyl transferase
MARSLVHEAAASHSVATSRGLLERLFARAFEGLVYPQIWEDPLVDMAALEIGPSTRLVTIASGGCNVMSYLTADPAEIVAVDLNRHHIALLRLKLAAACALPDHAAFQRFFADAADPANVAAFDRWIAPALDPQTRAYWNERVGLRRRIAVFGRGFYRTGLLGRTIGLAHLLARLHGRDPARMVQARTPQQQWELYATTLAPLFESPLLRAGFRLPIAYFGLGIPPAQLDAMKAEAGGDIVALVRDRVRRLACDFPIQRNYFAWQAFGRRYDPAGGSLPPYLEPEAFGLLARRSGRVTTRLASITELLVERATASVDAYVLLDAQDWMTPAQLGALWAQIDRTAAPGARVIFRTAAAPSPLEAALPRRLLGGWAYEAERSRELHARDRSAIYGGFHLYRRRAA